MSNCPSWNSQEDDESMLRVISDDRIGCVLSGELEYRFVWHGDLY